MVMCCQLRWVALKLRPSCLIQHVGWSQSVTHRYRFERIGWRGGNAPADHQKSPCMKIQAPLVISPPGQPGYAYLILTYGKN
jgi:hypothetical protein